MTGVGSSNNIVNELNLVWQSSRAEIIANQLHYLWYIIIHISMCKKQMHMLERHKFDSDKLRFITAAALHCLHTDIYKVRVSIMLSRH